MNLSSDAETLLLAMVDGEDGSIDARHWADAIVDLLRAGLVKIDGTLAQASIVVTAAGEQHAKSIVEEELS